MFDDLGREILQEASRSRGLLFYVYGPIGMGKSTLALWMSEIGKVYGLICYLFHGGRLYDKERVYKRLKKIMRGPGFFLWLKSIILRRPIRYFIIVDDVTEIEDRQFFETLVGILDNPALNVSISLFGNKPLEEWKMREVFTNRSFKVYVMEKPGKDKILEMIRLRIESVGGSGFGPLTIEEILEVIEKKETIRDILAELEKKVEEKIRSLREASEGFQGP